MARKIEINQSLNIDAIWQDTPIEGPLPEVNATLCRLFIGYKRHVATNFRLDNGTTGDRVEVPAYHLAEWLAHNWWAIFHEPLRDEVDIESDGFRKRHWLGSARNGFALPDLWLVPNGKELTLNCNESYLPASRITFTSAFDATLKIDEAKTFSGKFIDSVIDRLGPKLDQTNLHELWSLVKETSGEEESYCKLMGALGLSPYGDNTNVDKILDTAFDNLPHEIVKDICEASTAETFKNSVNMVIEAFKGLRNSGQEIQLDALPERPIEPSKKPWIWGQQAADKVRECFGVIATDREAGAKIFNYLMTDLNISQITAQHAENSEVEGAIERNSSVARLAIIRRREIPQRRFATARGVFLAWGAGDHDARLITRSHTREQQASRAFAAELLAPIDFIRKAAGSGPISSFRVKKIADELNVSPAVVQWQAQNHRLQLAAGGY